MESRLIALGVGGVEVEGLNKKEKGLMDTDNRVAIAGLGVGGGGRRYEGNTIQ